jgi:acetyl-CoA carboxylase biotin carboxyl carrier protein
MSKEIKPSGNKSMSQIDGDLVRQLAKILTETGLSEIEYDTGSLKIRVAKTVQQQAFIASAPMAAAAAAGPASPAAAIADDRNHPGAVKSPMVGVAYLSPEPGKPPFVKIGDSVSEGQTLLLIEAMKTYNPVKAPKSGKIAKIVVADVAPVEYGEPLMIIE